jgi:hypothetical protein
MRVGLVGVVVLVLADCARGETRTFELTLSAGSIDRMNVPVHMPLVLPHALAKAESVMLQTNTGQTIRGQLTEPSLTAEFRKVDGGGMPRELHFILPALKAGESATWKAILSTDGSDDRVQKFVWKDTPGEFMELLFGGRPVLRYMYKALDDSSKERRELTIKVYHHLYDPAGTRLVTKGPGGLYTHHRGLFFGFNRVSYGDNKKADVWHCTGDAYQSHERFVSTEAGPVLGRHRVEIAWHGPGKEVFAREEREVTVYNVSGGQLVEFASRVRTTAGPVKLDGDPQHAGFHFRAENEVADQTKKQTYFFRPDGKGGLGETRNWDPKTKKGPVNLPWNAMSFVLGPDRYTAAYLDHPANPKEARYSERDYGRFGSYFEYELTDAKPLVIDYRLWLQKGEMTGTEVAALDGGFVKPVRVSIKR